MSGSPVYEDVRGKRLQTGGEVPRDKVWELMETSFERYVAKEAVARVLECAGLDAGGRVDAPEEAAGVALGAMEMDRGGSEPLLPARAGADGGKVDYEECVTQYQRSIFEDSCGVSGDLGIAALRTALARFKQDKALEALLYGTAAAESLLVSRLSESGFSSELAALTTKQTNMMAEAQSIADEQARRAFIEERMGQMSDREREIGHDMSAMMQTAMLLNHMRQQQGAPLIMLTAYNQA